jgi:phage-related tail fiber protein
MAENFYSILTAVGLAKIANAQVSGNKVDLTQIAVGDGGGTYYNPTQSDTHLKNEVWRGNIGSVEIDPENPNWIVIESYIPSTVGGFTVREVGIFDAEGDMIAIGKYPETFKPSLEEGASKDLLLRMIIEVTNASAVTMKVDPSVIIASRKYVDEKVGVVSNNLMQLQQEFMSHSADSVKHVSQNEKDDWNNKLDKTGGTLTGNLAIHKGIPALIFGVPGRENDTRLFWNASTTNDFGLVFRVDGADALTLKSNKTIVDGNQRPVYTGTSVTVSQTPPQGTLANDAIHMVY